MTNANWLNTPGGLMVPPDRKPPSSGDIRQQAVLREALGIFHSAVDEFRETAELKENIGGGNGATLGAQSWNLEGQIGEKGFGGGAAEEVLRSLSEYLTTIQGGFYGSQYGYGYGTGSLQVGDVVKQISSLIWVFPEYNPVIKRMTEVRGLYVFGQGFEIRGESKKKKRARIRALQEVRLQKELDAQANAQISAAPVPGDEAGADGGGGMAKNALFQSYGASGHASSQPKDKKEEMQEEVAMAVRAGPMNLYMLLESYSERMEVDVDEIIQAWSNAAPSVEFLEGVYKARVKVIGGTVAELVEEYSGAGGGQQGSRMSTGSTYRLLGSDRESPQAKCVREFWEDARNLERFGSVESAQRVDKQKMIEGKRSPSLCTSKGLRRRHS